MNKTLAMVDSVNLPADNAVRNETVSPGASYIVQAPAGSGKTTLLVCRYLNLLTVVQQPEEVLAITFTEKAAREMKSRVLRALRNPDSQKLVDGALIEQVHERSRLLHWDLELNPQRMKIQTIDSFAYGIVQRMPIECQLSLDHHSMEKASDIYTDAAVDFFEQVLRPGEHSDNATEILSLFDNNIDQALQTLAAMLGRRENWIKSVQSVIAAKAEGQSDDLIFNKLEETRTRYVQQVIDQTIELVSDEFLEECEELCRKACENLDEAFDDFKNPEDWAILARTFLTKNGTLRKSITIREGFPPGTEEKNHWKTLRDEIDGDDIVINALQRVYDLPSGAIQPRHRDAFDALCLGLPTLIQKLNGIFQRQECIDFTELSFAAQRALERDAMPTELALALDYRISHILIDEYQDTSDAQYAFFERIMSTWTPDSGNSFFAVGDPMQSIYRFRNANLSLFQRTFNQDILNLNIVSRKLTSNFRSLPSLVEFNNKVFNKVFGTDENTHFGQVGFAKSTPSCKNLNEHSDANSVEFILTLNDPDGHREALEVATRIENILSTYDPDDKIALLVPTRTRLTNYFRAMKDKGLQWRGIEILKLKDAPVVRDLTSLVLAFNEDRDRLAWLSVFRSPLCGLTLPDLEQLARYDFGSEMLQCSSLTSTGTRLLARVAKAFELAHLESHLTLRSQIERLWFRLGGNQAYDDVDCMISAERFFELLEATTEREIRLHELWQRIEAEYVSESGENAVLDIMTIHKAKGLEFDHVLLVDISSTSRPNPRELVHWAEFESSLLVAVNDSEEPDPYYEFLRDEDKTRDANEQKRLLYVAMTRAKKSLSIFGRFKDGKQEPRSGTLLALLQPFYEDATVNNEESTDQPVTQTTGSVLERIDPDWVWQEPDSAYPLNASIKEPLPAVDTDDEKLRIFPVSLRREFVFGNLVHRELNWLSQISDYEGKFSTDRISSWAQYLLGEGIEESELSEWIDRTRTHLSNVLGDATGRWLLDSTHREAHSEKAYTGYIEEKLENIVIDRTFVDENDVRWIIDYKTTPMSKDISMEAARKFSTKQYGKQLSRYARIMSECESREIKCAIYYTDLPLLVNVDILS